MGIGRINSSSIIIVLVLVRRTVSLSFRRPTREGWIAAAMTFDFRRCCARVDDDDDAISSTLDA